MIIFRNFEPSSVPILTIKKKKNRHATAYTTLIILCSLNIIHSLTFSKASEKEPKPLKILENDDFS